MDRLRHIALRLAGIPYYWIKTRFTSAGRLVISALVVSALMGLDTNGNLAYQAFAFLAGVAAISLASGFFFRARLAVERRLPRFGTAGEALPYRIAVRNLGPGRLRALAVGEDRQVVLPTLEEFRRAPRPPKESTTFGERLAGYPRWRGLIRGREGFTSGELELPDLPPGGACELDAELTPSRRGRLRLAGIIVSRTDLLGLFKGFIRHCREESVLVLPKRYPVGRISLPGRRRYQQGGVALSSAVGDSREFVFLREYRPGDPLRRIHWRSAARAGELVVKEFQDEYFVRHALVLDTFAGGGREELFEEAVSVAASLACGVLTQESLLDLLFVGAQAYCFTAGRGLGGAEKMLEILACAQVCREKSFAELRHSVLRRSAQLSGTICVLMTFDEERRRLVRELRAAGVPVKAVVLTRPGERSAIEEEGVHRLEAGKIPEGLAKL